MIINPESIFRFEPISLEENHFYRITLVNKIMTERITIDTYLEFNNLKTDNKIELPEIGIIE